jgi:DNA-binding response OmpR family regulator
MKNKQIYYDHAVNKLTSTIIKKVFRNGELDIKSCISIADYIYNLDIGNEKEISQSRHGKFRIDKKFENYRVMLKLSDRSSYLILDYLMQNPGSWHSIEDISYNISSSSGSIRVFICSLRKSLREVGLTDVIDTRYGIGYSISDVNVQRITTHVAATNEPV